jgi:hypothetical protein
LGHKKTSHHEDRGLISALPFIAKQAGMIGAGTFETD